MHADYDRNGSLAANAAEYLHRNLRPGAVVVPNLDADGRALPASVKSGGRVVLDRDQPVKPANDDENLLLRILTRKASAPAGSQFFLRIPGRARFHVEFHDSRGVLIGHASGAEDEIPFTPPAVGGNLNLSMEARSFAGTPKLQAQLRETVFEDDGDTESSFAVDLFSRDPSGQETLWDTAEFTLAPVIFTDNLAPVSRMYICEAGHNAPSVAEVEEALALVKGVTLLKVPPDVGGGDTWLGDQYRHGLMQGGDGFRQVLINLPRLENSNAVTGSGGNLADLVASHFPSRQVGVFDVLRNRVFTLEIHTGGIIQVSFRDTLVMAKALEQVLDLRALLIERIQRLDDDFTAPVFTVPWSFARRALRDLYDIFRRRLRAAVSSRRITEPIGRELDRDTRQRLERVETLMPMPGGNFTLPTGSGAVTTFDRIVDQLRLRLIPAHKSSNSGGNILASPPIGADILGKLVIGNRTVRVTDSEEFDFMDPDLFRILNKQNKQPIVKIDTTWLRRGKVDEILAFVPDQTSDKPGFAIFLASGLLAQKILVKARDRYKAGLPAGPHFHTHDEPFILDTNRLTTDGTSPVTRLFRGKVWHHIHRPEPATGVEPPFLEPPRIYQRLADLMGNSGDFRFAPGAGDGDRLYLADITVREAAWCEQDEDDDSVNEFIENSILFDIPDLLKREFREARRFPVPVLFDRVADLTPWGTSTARQTTMAFTPSLVNLQVVNGRLLVPRPYGPRMRLDDAHFIFHEVIREMDLDPALLNHVNDDFARQRKLYTGVYWIHRYDTSLIRGPNGLTLGLTRGLLNEADIIGQFKDSFPGASEADLRRDIITPNRLNFNPDGTLKDGWRKFTITDNMVDLFETWFMMVAADLFRVPVSWVDSWHYHVHGGGIHSGTNVLRSAKRGVTPSAWDAPDVQSLQNITVPTTPNTVPNP